MSMLLANDRSRFLSRRPRLVLPVVAAAVFLVTASVNQAQDAPPEDYVAPESVDLTADSYADTIFAAPSGADPQGPDPGEVYVVSGADGSVVITLIGNTADDWFGYSVAVAGDLNDDGFDDLIVGAPKDEAGKAFVFYGPFDGTGPLEITAANADMAFSSPDPDDYDFGDAVGRVSDLTGDGIPELRIRAWFLDADGFETAHTYILSGATGDPLFRITGDDPFDPWAQVIGDTDGDGDVDQDDLDIILANQDLVGADLTAYDGDINGDGIVDMTDYNLAQANFGFNAFASLIGGGVPCLGGPGQGEHCPEDCDGVIIMLPGNVDPECRPFHCPQDAACVYTIFPQPMPGQPHPVEWEVEVTILVYPHVGDSATWDVLDGAELIEILEITANTFRFRTIEFGPVLINASYLVCHEFCSMDIPITITWIDSDSDGLPDSWEEMMGLDPNNPDTDGDGILDGDEDYDGDGLSNHDEWVYGTDPMNPDTDGDGVSDGDEVAQGSNPNDPADGGQAPDPEDLIEVTLQVGDHSGSHSELWLLQVGDIRFKAPGYGEVTPPTVFQFLRSNSYPINLIHLDSTLDPPDYDYTAHVTPEPGSCAIVDDPPQPVNPLLGVYEMTVACPQDGHPPDCNPAAGKVATLILPTGDLTVFRPNTPRFQLTAVPDEFEETSNDPTIHPGAGVRFNGDDDNGNGVPDHTESPVTNEGDLVRLEVTGDPPFLPDSHEWVLRRSNPAIKLWKTPTKGFTELFGDDDTAPADSLAWFIEWVNPNTNTATLELGVREVGGAEVCVVDTIALYRFTSIVIALGGRDQVPADPPNEPTNHGTFVLAIDLYQQGYDVYMFNEQVVEDDGTGPPYDEIVDAVQKRQVQSVGMYGYSWGGGAIYKLANGLTTPAIVPNFACYIDAVTNDGFGAENRRPPAVMYHLNMYQQANWPQGGPIEGPLPGDEEFDVINDWGLDVTHGTIDDNSQVLSTVENRLKLHVPSR